MKKKNGLKLKLKMKKQDPQVSINLKTRVICIVGMNFEDAAHAAKRLSKVAKTLIEEQE